jgi:eukaryotic-like serine/threonine-protein kinase
VTDSSLPASGSSWTRKAFLRHRTLLLGTLLAAALIAGIGGWSLGAVRRTLEDGLRSELETDLKANVTALELWIQGQLRTAKLLASDPTVREPASAALQQSRTLAQPSAPGPGPGGGTNSAFSRFSFGLEDRIQLAGYVSAVLVGTNNRVVASTGRMRIRPGTTVPSDHSELYQRVLATGEPALITPFKPIRPGGRPGQGVSGGRGGGLGWMGRGGSGGTNGPPPGPPGLGGTGGTRPRMASPSTNAPRGELQVMQVLAPVRDDAGRIQGVLALVLRPEAEFTRVLSVARTGKSGETFAFDPEGRLLSQSRFEEPLRQLGLLTNSPGVTSALNLVLRDPGLDLTRGGKASIDEADRALMTLVARAINEPTGVSVEATRDYRGVPVVGAWQWVEEHHFGVVTKIDADEAFRSLRVLRWIFRILLLFVVLGAVVGIVASHAGSVWRRRFNEAQLRARQLGQYTLLERIGEGAMGVVYRGRHALLRRDTAVKLLLPDRADEGLIRQFEHEVQLTCRLTHPNTIQVYDYGHTADGIFYYAMELLEGMTWEELVDRHGPVPQERLIHLLRQAAGSLQEAHAAGLIHRDIKPGNLFLCERGGIPDTVKVLDFGLVREVSAGAGPDSIPTQAARFLGTPLYMAPETIRTPGHGDVSTDIYALGAVAYHLATGQPVFVADSVEATWDLHLTAEPVALGRKVPGAIGPELEGLILDCLAKEPAGRPVSMEAFLARLDACPVEKPWTPERQRSWWRQYGARTGVLRGSLTGKPNAAPPAATIRIALEER